MYKYLYITTLIFFLSCNNGQSFNDKPCLDNSCCNFDYEFEEFELFNKNYLEERDIVYVPDSLKYLNDFLKSNIDKTIVFKKQKYSLHPFKLNSNQQLIIPNGTYLELDSLADLPLKGGYLIAAEGSENKRLNNVKIVLDGIIDGNKQIHSYNKSGNEGITYRYIDNSVITGSGVIRNFSGDGIDIDYATKLIINGVKTCSNSGSGLHFGSPRPIESSFNNIVANVKSTNNGFLVKRNGIDLSWPNDNGAIFINSYSYDNYRNWEIEATGGIIINSFSFGETIEEDVFSGADKVIINNMDITNKSFISKKRIIEFKSLFKKVY